VLLGSQYINSYFYRTLAKINSILASTTKNKKMIISLFRNFLIGFFIILTSYIHCQEYESIGAYESSEFGQIMVTMVDENNLEIISDYRNDECECDAVKFTFTKNIGDNNFYTKDKLMSLYYLADDIIIKNKKSDICCQLGTGLYEPYINHRWDEENDLSEETDSDINNNLNFLNGFWKDNYNGGQIPYELQYSESENILNIVNEDDEVMVSLSQVSNCGSYDSVFTIIMTSGENCWYIDDVSSDLIIIWTSSEDELDKQYELEKITD
jgi:hypothetical protein